MYSISASSVELIVVINNPKGLDEGSRFIGQSGGRRRRRRRWHRLWQSRASDRIVGTQQPAMTSSAGLNSVIREHWRDASSLHFGRLLSALTSATCVHLRTPPPFTHPPPSSFPPPPTFIIILFLFAFCCEFNFRTSHLIALLWPEFILNGSQYETMTSMNDGYV